MEHPEAKRPTQVIAERIRELRTRRGWSAQQLAEQMAAVGIPWERMVVTKLETGRRPNVSVEEMLALAYVLDVAPVHLLVPTDEADDALYRIVPSGTALRIETARAWIRGFQPVRTSRPGGPIDGRRYFAEVPLSEPAGGTRGFTQPSTDKSDEASDGER